MSKVLVTESHLEDIADAIRAKNGLSTEYRPGDMAAAIAAIPSGGITPAGTINITQNGTVDVTNYASAAVSVSGGGGGGIDASFLPNSVAADIVASSLVVHPEHINLIGAQRFYVDLSAANTDVTCYAVTRNRSNGESIMICVPYANSNGNNPCFYTPSGGYYVECTVYSGNTRVDGVTCDVDHVYALSIDAAEKKVRYYLDGAYLMEKSFNNSGACVVVGAGDKNGSSYSNGNAYTSYFGVVAGLESDAIIIANQQTIMTKLGMSA